MTTLEKKVCSKYKYNNHIIITLMVTACKIVKKWCTVLYRSVDFRNVMHKM